MIDPGIKKKKGALALIAFGAPKSSPSLDDDEEEEGGESHKAAFESFANAAGIDEAARPRAQAALKQFVYACIGGHGTDDTDEE